MKVPVKLDRTAARPGVIQDGRCIFFADHAEMDEAC